MKSIQEYLKGCEHDGSYIPVSEVKRLLQEYAEAYHTAKMQEVTSGEIETPEYEKAVLDYLENGINYDCPAFTPHFKENYLEQFVFDTWFAAIKWERGKTDHTAKMAGVKIALKDGIKTRTYQTRFNIPCDFPQEKVEQMIDEIIDEMFIRASESNDR